MADETLINKVIVMAMALRPDLTLDKIAREAGMHQPALSRARKHGGREETLRKVIEAVAKLTGRSLSVEIVVSKEGRRPTKSASRKA